MDTSGVANPAPTAVYQSYATAQSGTGNKIAWSLPVPNGSYTIRLHFVALDTAANQRKFDIKLQDTTVQSDYDIRATAGARPSTILIEREDRRVHTRPSRGVVRRLVALGTNLPTEMQSWTEVSAQRRE